MALDYYDLTSIYKIFMNMTEILWKVFVLQL